MPLAAGTRLGPYEVVSAIGKGGMGEVYRARDTKLDRDVAIKVFPEVFAKDKERLARFEREAKLLASLNHPNIASIYGLEESDGVKTLVLELVEGPTLAERIAQGPIPVDEAIAIAKQIPAREGQTPPHAPRRLLPRFRWCRMQFERCAVAARTSYSRILHVIHTTTHARFARWLRGESTKPIGHSASIPRVISEATRVHRRARSARQKKSAPLPSPSREPRSRYRSSV